MHDGVLLLNPDRMNLYICNSLVPIVSMKASGRSFYRTAYMATLIHDSEIHLQDGENWIELSM